MKLLLFFIYITLLYSCVSRSRDRNDWGNEKKYIFNAYFPRFLNKSLHSKNINIHTDSLLHRTYADSADRIQTDTFQSKDILITVKTFTGEKEGQRIIINGETVRDYKWDGTDSNRMVMYTLSDILHRFNFKGKEFYYLTAGEINCSGGSAAVVHYQLIYDVQKKVLNEFSHFRVRDFIFAGDVNNDEWLDFLEVNNAGGMNFSDDNDFTVTLYSNNAAGGFDTLKDANRKAYYLNGYTGDAYYVGDSIHIADYYWPVALK